MTKQLILTVPVTPRQYLEVQHIAKSRGVSVSHAMREALDTWLASPPVINAAPYRSPKDVSYVVLDEEVKRTRALWKPYADASKRNQGVDEDAYSKARSAFEAALKAYRDATRVT